MEIQKFFNLQEHNEDQGRNPLIMFIFELSMIADNSKTLKISPKFCVMANEIHQQVSLSS